MKWRVKDNGRYVNVAKYRAFDASVPFATREAWQTTREGMLPPLGQKLLVGEQEQILLEASRGADEDRLIELLYDDTERHVEAVRSRIELAWGDVLTDGKFTLAAENGLTIEVDWGSRPTTCPRRRSCGATRRRIRSRTSWPGSSTWTTEARRLPEMVLTSRKAFSFLAANNSYRAAYYGSVNPSNTPTATLTPQQINVVRDNYGLPPVTFYKGQVRVDGVQTKVLPEDRWILLPPDRSKWGQTIFGVTAEALALSRGTNPEITKEDRPGIIITRGAQDDPVQIWTKGAAVGMPVLHTPDAHIVAKVI